MGAAEGSAAEFWFAWTREGNVYAFDLRASTGRSDDFTFLR